MLAKYIFCSVFILSMPILAMEHNVYQLGDHSKSDAGARKTPHYIIEGLKKDVRRLEDDKKQLKERIDELWNTTQEQAETIEAQRQELHNPLYVRSADMRSRLKTITALMHKLTKIYNGTYTVLDEDED